MMFWEIIATAMVGVLVTGVILSIRLFYKKLPKWVIPAGAGLGMLIYQVYAEYSWAEHMMSRLPKETVVVASVPKTAWYRPWSYVKPQVLQFVALDKTSIVPVLNQADTKQATLYFFERREAAAPLGITVDCTDADSLAFDAAMRDNIMATVCQASTP